MGDYEMIMKWKRIAVCPVCKEENSLDGSGQIIKVCEHFYYATREEVRFDPEGKSSYGISW